MKSVVRITTQGKVGREGDEFLHRGLPPCARGHAACAAISSCSGCLPSITSDPERQGAERQSGIRGIGEGTIGSDQEGRKDVKHPGELKRVRVMEEITRMVALNPGRVSQI